MAIDLRLAIYRELPVFKEACQLLDQETPPVAANETVISEGGAELQASTQVVPSVHEVSMPMEVDEQPEVATPGASTKRHPLPTDSPSPMRKKANLKQDSPVVKLLSKNTLTRLARSAKSKLYRPLPQNPDMPDPSAMSSRQWRGSSNARGPINRSPLTLNDLPG